MGRELVVGAVAFAAGLALGLLLRGDSASMERQSVAETRPSMDPPAATPREPTRRPRGTSTTDEPSASADTSTNAAAIPLSADVREIPLADAPTGFADVDVEVVDAEGRPVDDATVYALRVGAPGVNDEDDVPNASSGADGRCRLRVPAPGTFDVAAIDNGALGRVEDVVVPRASGVRVVVPPHVDVVFVADASTPIGVEFDIHLARAMRDGARHLPARGEPQHDSAGNHLSAGFLRDAWSLTAGATFAVSSRPDIEFEPREFTAPATVVVRRIAGREMREMRLLLRIAGVGVVWRRDRVVRYSLEFDDGSRRDDFALLRMSDGPWQANYVHFVRAERGTITWSGPDVAPGSATWDLAVSTETEVRMDAPDRPPDAARAVRFLVDLPKERADENGAATLVFEEGGDPSDLATGRVVVGEETTIDVPGDWIVVDLGEYAGDGDHRLVAGPARIRRGERMTMTPRAGGFVVFTPSGAVSPSAGAVEVARADGAPFGNGRDGDVRWSLRCNATPGIVLGPFEPGAVVLDVFVGHVLWGRYEVTVRADDYVPLTPRRFVDAPR